MLYLLMMTLTHLVPVILTTTILICLMISICLMTRRPQLVSALVTAWLVLRLKLNAVGAWWRSHAASNPRYRLPR